MMEVDHRAMNALALVQSIVSLTRAGTDEGLARAIKRRVDSLARAHRLLSEHRWRSVPLHDLLVTQLAGEPGPRIMLEGPAVLLPAHVVQPLALVLHELVSNAGLHGALSSNEGNVLLSWTDNLGALHLNWHEEGPTLRNAQIAENFGLEIGRAVTERQLNGQLSMALKDGALDASLWLPGAVELQT